MSALAAHNPRVSVVVPCYNHARFLPDAVASIHAQTLHDWELIIVDDGSTDDSAVVADNLIAQYPQRAIRLLRQPNSGLSASRNAGIAAARGAYMLPLDADDALHPDMLAVTAAVLDACPMVGFVYTDVQMVGVETTLWSGGAYSLAKLRFDCPMMPASLFRQAAWAQVGGFRTKMRRGYEDWDFWLALAEAGWQGQHIARPLVTYRRTNNSMLAHARRHDLELRAQVILHHPALYEPDFVAWAQRVRSPAWSANDKLHTSALWWRAWAGYARCVARHAPALLSKTLVRPLFTRLSARQQGHARRLARRLRLTQSTARL